MAEMIRSVGLPKKELAEGGDSFRAAISERQAGASIAMRRTSLTEELTTAATQEEASDRGSKNVFLIESLTSSLQEEYSSASKGSFEQRLQEATNKRLSRQNGMSASSGCRH